MTDAHYNAGETVYLDGKTKATVLFNTHDMRNGDDRVVVTLPGIGEVKVEREHVSRERRKSIKQILRDANSGPMVTRPAFLGGYLVGLAQHGRVGLTELDRERLRAASELLVTLGKHEEARG